MSQQIQLQSRPGAVQQTQQVPTGRTFETRSYLSEDVRQSSIRMLNQTLVDTTDLLTQAKAAHWNVRGQNFYQLHELFEEIAETLARHADEIAERATALGGQAMGTARITAASSQIPELPSQVALGSELVRLLAERVAVHDANLGECIRQASEMNDLDTADLLNEVSREVSKILWFLEAHLNTQPIDGGQGAGTEGQQALQNQSSPPGGY